MLVPNEAIASTQQREKYLPLEGLRGVLALLVCCGHLGLTTVTVRFGFRVRFGLAVDVFFALSAFVLCHTNYFARRTFAEFTIGRVARLYPLHALTAIAVLAMGPARHAAVTSAEIAQQFTLTQNIGLPPNHLALNFPAWSVSVEFWIAWLFYGVMISRRRRWPWLLLAAIVLPIAFADITRGDAQNAAGVVNIGILRALGAFSVGTLAYLAFEKIGARFVAPQILSYSLIASLAFLMTRPAWPASAMLAFYAAVFALLVSLPSNDRATVFRSRPLVWLGTVSYSVYLLHMPVLFALQLAFGERVLAGAGKALVIAAVLIAAHVSHRWIEVPWQRRIREAGYRFSSRFSFSTSVVRLRLRSLAAWPLLPPVRSSDR